MTISLLPTDDRTGRASVIWFMIGWVRAGVVKLDLSTQILRRINSITLTHQPSTSPRESSGLDSYGKSRITGLSCRKVGPSQGAPEDRRGGSRMWMCWKPKTIGYGVLVDWQQISRSRLPAWYLSRPHRIRACFAHWQPLF
jgi:hypothetical protein